MPQMKKEVRLLAALISAVVGGFGIAVYAHSLLLGMGIAAIAVGFIIVISSDID